jgi:uncharacterized protein (TIGR00255 family)
MPLQSMTAYGFGESPGEDGLTYTTEIRTLNSRFLEVNVRLPRHLLALETEIINHVKGELRRGKVDVFVDAARQGTSRDLPEIDIDAVKHYARLFDKVQQAVEESLVSSFASLQDPSATDFFRLDGVLQNPDRLRPRGASAAESHKAGIFKALGSALDHVKEARRKEGDSLQTALGELLTALETDRAAVLAKRQEIVTHLQKQLVKRVEAALASLAKAGTTLPEKLSEERMMSEIAVLSDRVDIEEELTRLETHIKEFARLMVEEEGAGRKLDFMCQEMHREVNTMSNKLVQTEVSQHTLEMKQTIERIRQQVQNIE